MREPELKRGYYKWIDEDGVKHKVSKADYEAVQEIEEDVEVAEKPHPDSMANSVRD